MPETATAMTPERLNAVYSYAGQQMHKGAALAEIETSLIEQGLDPDAAAVVVSNLTQARAEACYPPCFRQTENARPISTSVV